MLEGLVKFNDSNPDTAHAPLSPSCLTHHQRAIMKTTCRTERRGQLLAERFGIPVVAKIEMFNHLFHHWVPRIAALVAGVMVIDAGIRFVSMASSSPSIESLPQTPVGGIDLRMIGAFHLGLGMLAIVGAVLARWTRTALATTLAVGLLIVLAQSTGLAAVGVTDLNGTIGLREAAFWVIALIGFVLAS